MVNKETFMTLEDRSVGLIESFAQTEPQEKEEEKNVEVEVQICAKCKNMIDKKEEEDFANKMRDQGPTSPPSNPPIVNGISVPRPRFCRPPPAPQNRGIPLPPLPTA